MKPKSEILWWPIVQSVAFGVVASIIIFFLTEPSVTASVAGKSLVVFAGVILAAVFLYLERHRAKIRTIRDEIYQTNKSTQALIELFRDLGEITTFIRGLLPKKDADDDLATFLMKKVSVHVWRIPHARPKEAYELLGDAIGYAEAWEAIHTADLDELGERPLDKNSGSVRRQLVLRFSDN